MKELKCTVKEEYTNVRLVSGTYDYCSKWIDDNCVFDEDNLRWIDANNEPVIIEVEIAE